MPTENSAIHPLQKASGSLLTLTAAPQKKALSDTVVESAQSSERVESQTQTYMDRIRNYVPVEVIGFFIFVNAMIKDDGDGKTLTGADSFVAIGSVVVALAAACIFARMANEKADTKVWIVQAMTSSVAFLVWAYAIGAEAVKVIKIPQEPVIAAFLLATFSLFSGLIVPLKKTPSKN